MRFAIVLFLVVLSSSSFAETLIVKLKPGMVSAYSQELKSKARFNIPRLGIYVVDGNIEKISKRPEIQYVERNIKYKALYVSQTAAPMWGLEITKVKSMWDKGVKGKGIKIAVIDTGVESTHIQLNGRVLEGFNAITGTSDAKDDHGHGTHCSGTIAGATVGMAPEAEIVPVKFLDKEGSGSLEDAIKSIEFAKNAKVHIMSNSWGGGGFSQALYDVIKSATDEGIIFLAAAGNEYNDNDKNPSYPASYDLPIISVAASDSSDKMASFSNYGKKSVTLLAPGVGIFSSVIDGKYDTWSGTSMATPHVAGAVALMIQDGCTDVMKCVVENTKDIGLYKKVKNGRLEFK